MCRFQRIMCRQLSQCVNRGNKLLPRSLLPLQVMNKTDLIYTIEDPVSGKRIHCFIYDPIRTNPQHNEQEFIVESILGRFTFVGLDSTIRATTRNHTRPSYMWTSFMTTCAPIKYDTRVVDCKDVKASSGHIRVKVPVIDMVWTCVFMMLFTPSMCSAQRLFCQHICSQIPSRSCSSISNFETCS